MVMLCDNRLGRFDSRPPTPPTPGGVMAIFRDVKLIRSGLRSETFLLLRLCFMEERSRGELKKTVNSQLN